MPDYSKVGLKSRKMGLTPRERLRIDNNGMEDINDFFVDNSADEEEEEVTVKNEPAPEYSDVNDDQYDDHNDVPDEDFLNATGMSPIKPRKRYSRRLESSPIEGPSPHSSRNSRLHGTTPLDDHNDDQEPTETFIQNLDQLSPDSDIDDHRSKKGKAIRKLPSRRGGAITKQMALTKNRGRRRVVPEMTNQEETPGTPPSSPELHKLRSPSADTSGLRRSSRTRVRPIAFWKNERVVYETVKEGDAHLSVIKSVAKGNAQAPPIRKIPRSASTPSSAKPKKPRKRKMEDLGEGAEWISKGFLAADIPTPDGELLTRKIAFQSDNLKNPLPITSDGQDYTVYTMFDMDNEWAAGGILEVSEGGYKSITNSAESYYMFYVVHGTLRVNVADREFVATEGCAFEVPQHIEYGFSNISSGPVKLFFVQNKPVLIASDEGV